MSIIIFVIILGILIFVHELGHFLAAKFFGVRVDEFALGFPPRIAGKKIGETEYVLNIVPIGGYVKIPGENGETEFENEPKADAGEKPLKSGLLFGQVSRWKQAVILMSGVLGNIIFATLAITAGFMWGLPTAAEGPYAAEIQSQQLMITSVMPGSPADKAGLVPGDRVLSIKRKDQVLEAPSAETTGDLISSAPDNTPVYFVLSRNHSTTSISVMPESGIIEGKKAIGIAMEYAGILKLPIHKAFVAGVYATASMTKSVAESIWGIISDAFRGRAQLSSFTGPVGIAMMVGDAERAGFANLLILVVLISINLAVINLVPVPALDGGRLLFVLIESVIRKPLNPKFSRMANQIGMIALLLLFAVITYKDIIRYGVLVNLIKFFK